MPAPSAPNVPLSTTELAQILGILGSGFSYLGRGFSSLHQGMDFPAATGTPIRALQSGTVAFAGDAGAKPGASLPGVPNYVTGGGNVVAISTGDLSMSYAHMSKLLVTQGQTVTKGQVIGEVGSTGYAFGSHLHIGVWSESAHKFLDPKPYILGAASSYKTGDTLPGFGFLVSFPVGYKLTDHDIDTIVNAMNAAGWFHDTNPADTGIFGEVKARNAVADTLKQFSGREWSPALLVEMSAALGLKSNTVDANPIADIAATIGKVIGALFDAENWLLLFALAAGIGLAAYGGKQIIAATAVPIGEVTPS